MLVQLMLKLGLLSAVVFCSSFAVAQPQTSSLQLGSSAVLNVREFGARGDGITDDTSAIRAAISALPAGGVLFLPPGTYLISATLDFSSKSAFMLLGSSTRSGGAVGTTIIGSVAGDLVRSVGATSFLIRGINFQNTSPLAQSALHVEGFVNGVVEWSQITSAGAYGLYAPANTFTFNVRNVKFNGSGHTGIGFYTGGHTLIESCDVTGWDEGIRASGTTVTIIGSRVEINKTGVRLGVNESNKSFTLSRSLISGNSFEANDIHIEVNAVSSTVFSGMGMQGSIGSPSGHSKVGVLIRGATASHFSGLHVGGSYSDAAIRAFGTGGASYSFLNVLADNGTATAKTWDIQGGLSDITFHGTNYKIRSDDTVSVQYLQRHGTFQYVSQIDYLNPNVEGKNLRGKNISVTPAATRIAIAFTSQHNAGAAVINTSRTTMGGSLAPGIYYYVATAVTSHGETAGTGEKRVVVSAPNNAVAITFFGMTQDGFKRRIYRGTQPGVYDGYFETSLNSNTTFTDSGGPFSGRRSPPTAGIDETGMIEPDANYAVLVTPSWNTTYWVTGKATTGFTINFGTAAPRSGGTIDYFMVR